MNWVGLGVIAFMVLAVIAIILIQIQKRRERLEQMRATTIRINRQAIREAQAKWQAELEQSDSSGAAESRQSS